MHALLLFAGSFTLVFLLTIQQHNVSLQRHAHAAVNSAAIGLVTIANIRLGGQADIFEIGVYVAAQPLATLLSMRISNRSTLAPVQRCPVFLDRRHTTRDRSTS